MGVPVAGSHSRTVISLLAVAGGGQQGPPAGPGHRAHRPHRAGMLGQRFTDRGGGVPQSHRRIPAGGDHGRAETLAAAHPDRFVHNDQPKRLVLRPDPFTRVSG